MEKKKWKSKIKDAMKNVGVYNRSFDSVVDTLAGILERRDEAEDLFQKSGGNILVKHTNKSGATNIEQNPALRLINDLNRDALAHWRALGLTPSDLKRLNEAAMKEKKGSILEEALRKLGSA